MPNRRIVPMLAAALACALFALLAVAHTALAGPAAPIDTVITQPDGSTVTARQWGDEWQHGLETAEGYTLVQDPASSYYVYAHPSEDGSLSPILENGKPLIAGKDSPPALEKHLRPTPTLNPFASQRLSPSADLPKASFNGTTKLLVILGQFDNQNGFYSSADFQAKAFGAAGSIQDFYTKASFGKLALVPAEESSGVANDGVIGWVPLGMYHPNGLNEYVSQSVARAALTAANGSINYAAFDTDGDGYVTSKELVVLIVAAGYEASFSGSYTPKIWAHQYNLDSYPLQLDGKYVGGGSADGDYGGYAIIGERHGDHIAQVGTMVHELGHELSWPDLYDISNQSEGVGNWSVMGGGSWNRTMFGQYGDNPALPDAWSKWYQGWITPTQAVDQATYSLASAGDNPQALVLGHNPNGVDWDFTSHRGSGEYWLVENRQQTGYDSGLPGCGLLVWHIDETVTDDNYANANRDDPLVQLEQADGTRGLYYGYNRGDAGDPFPGTSHNTQFNTASYPNSLRYNNSPSFFDLSIQTTSCTLSMSVKFSGPKMVYLPAIPSFEFAPLAPPPAASTAADGAKKASYQLVIPQPYKRYLPLVSRYALANIDGVVTDNGVPVNGATVQLLTSSDSGLHFFLNTDTLTGADGKYQFPTMYMADTDRYFVYWSNNGTPNRLAEFFGKIAGNTSASHTWNFDLHDIRLLFPNTIDPLPLPITFQWGVRGFSGDSYALEIWDENFTLMGITDPLGYTDRYTLTTLPPGVIQGSKYLWSVRAYTPYGYGESYYAQPIYFNTAASPALNTAAPAGWNIRDAAGGNRLPLPKHIP